MNKARLANVINTSVRHRLLTHITGNKGKKHNFIKIKLFLGMQRTSPSQPHQPYYKTILKCSLCNKKAAAELSDWDEVIELKPTLLESQEECKGVASASTGQPKQIWEDEVHFN